MWPTMKEMLNLGISPADIHVTIADRRQTSSSSKGNQRKWFKDGNWLKGDYMGYEGLAECLASWVARHTNIGDFAPVADYYQCNIHEEGKRVKGCYSLNFLAEGEASITVQRLLDSQGVSLDKRTSTADQVKLTVDTVVAVTGIADFGKWLTCLIEFDSLILNEDRHLHNIAVIRRADGTFRLMTLFDNGAGFCSDTAQDFPMHTPALVCARSVKSKPFNIEFKKQVRACRGLYGEQLRVDIAAADVTAELLSNMELYSGQQKQRVAAILRHQLGASGQ